MSIQCLLSSIFCFGLLFSVFVFHLLDIIIKHLSNSIMVISFAQRISRDWLWKVHLPWLAIKGKGDESLTEKESDMGGPNWIEILTTTWLEARFTWRFEGLLADFWISSRWISFHSPALKYLEILGNAFRATWPGNIIQMTLDDIWHQTPGVGQQRKYKRQGFQIRVPGTDSPFQ